MARNFWNYVYKYTYTVNIQKNSIYTAPACISLPPDSIISQVLFSPYCTAPLIYLRADISNFLSDRWLSTRFSDIYQTLEYLTSTGLLYIYQNFIRVFYVYQISLHLLELHWSTLCLPDFLTSIRTSLEYFMFTRFPYIYQNFI